MEITSGIVLFAVSWWIALLCVLPFGVRSQEESGRVVPGTSPGAPERPRMKRNFILATLIACLVWVAVYTALKMDLLDITQWTWFLPMPGERPLAK